MIDLTFVIPVYKVPYKLLQNAIDSVLNQTHSNIELILVDDGSPDACGSICDENASKDSRIVVIHKKNEGLSEARNSGTRIAKSKWITYIDGDDWVESDFAEFFLQRVNAQQKEADFYIFNGYRNFKNAQVECAPYYSDGKRFQSYEEREALQIECCLVPTKNNGNRLFIGSGWAKVYNVEFLKSKSLYFNVVPYGEDSIFFMYSVENAETIEYVTKPIYHYRDTEGGMVNGYRKNANLEQKIYTQALFDFAKLYNKKSDFCNALYLRVFISMQRCVSQKFFNKSNPSSFIGRIKECNDYFSQPPFCDIYSHIKFVSLNRNSKIKYLIFRFKLYFLFNQFRGLYLRNKDQISQKR